MTRAAVALGGNLGPVAETFAHALQKLRLAGVSLVARGGLYDTTPVGTPGDGQRYLNSACLVETSLSPQALLDELQRVERELGRVREIAWGPRPLDLDLIWYGAEVCETPRLTLPHPACWYRRFVLEPLGEVCPDWRHPDKGLTVAELRDRWRSRPVTIALAGGSPAWRQRLLSEPPALSPGVRLVDWEHLDRGAAGEPRVIAWRGTAGGIAEVARPRTESADTDYRRLPADRRLDISREAAHSDAWLTFLAQSVGDEPRRVGTLDWED
ncbi:MAG: 2-amino-4-hydroxy-6-hydroxymethyldihydropteridine diphosphokinase [Planctomycetaceae bacterium]|jgi:2-amino-4-hydroxy-6-hydroxymethyldihydropteridine diphosphokinase